jgi:hypothetical protein
VIEQIEETTEQVQGEQPKEQRANKQQEEREKEAKRLKRLGWTYVATTGFINRKLRRQLIHGGSMYLDEQEGCYRQNG